MSDSTSDRDGPAWSKYEVCAEQMAPSKAHKLVGIVLDVVTSQGEATSAGRYRVFVREISSGNIVHEKAFGRRRGKGDDHERTLRAALSAETADEFARRFQH